MTSSRFKHKKPVMDEISRAPLLEYSAHFVAGFCIIIQILSLRKNALVEFQLYSENIKGTFDLCLFVSSSVLFGVNTEEDMAYWMTSSD